MTYNISDLWTLFTALRDEWEKETRFISSATEITNNVHYQMIIGLGPQVIPLIFNDWLTSEPHQHRFWFWALYCITREIVVVDEHAGNIGLMVEDWLEWGKQHGYVESYR